MVAQALSLPVSAPVPEDYAKQFDAENPSTYGEHVAFTGPYMVENDAETGELDRLHAGQGDQAGPQPELGPRGTATTGPAYLDEITFQEGFADTASASRKILDGERQVNGDFPPPPTCSSRQRPSRRGGPADG